MKKTWASLLLSSVLAACQPSHDKSDPPAPSDELDNAYQLGDAWTRYDMKSLPTDLAGDFETLNSLSQSVGHLHGTWIYLGVHGDAAIAATNAHVVRALQASDENNRTLISKSSIAFPSTGDTRQYVPVKRVLGVWPEVDFAIVELESADARGLGSSAFSLLSNSVPQQGRSLLTLGYGKFRNPEMRLTAGSDEDCRVVSASGDWRKISDPDRLNHEETQVWSFAHACDVSHGDSGAPILDLATGELLGIVWTTATPAVNRRDSKWVSQLNTTASSVWSDLSYAVPLQKIRDIVCLDLLSHATDPNIRPILESAVCGK